MDPFSTVLGNLERLAAQGKITRPATGFAGVAGCPFTSRLISQ